MPTARQYEAFILRCCGLRYREIGERMFISSGHACDYANDAARKLLAAPPTPANASDRALALHNFPHILARLLEETT
jgi:DNA-directed RNA polymerase specialized sigma24 family protein